MDCEHSVVVDPSTYYTESLCDGIPLRMHVYSHLENIGIIRAQEDWSRLVKKVHNYKGGLGPKYSFISVTVPGCLPDRLEIISYANEIAFLHDDVTDNVNQEEGDIENDQMMAAFREGAQTGTSEVQKDGKREIQSKMLLEMLAIDRQRALTTMKAWAEYVEIAAGRKDHTHFTTLDEYIPHRILDCGQMFLFGIFTFGMAITIPDHEMDTCDELTRYAWLAAALTNDLVSWQKEYDASKQNGKTFFFNAVWILMGEHSITVDEAKELCRKKIKEIVAKYMEIVEDSKKRTDISLDLRKYIDALQYTISGNVAWSFLCPRYNPEATYNDFQLSLTKNGVDKSRLDSDARFDLAFLSQPTNVTNDSNGVTAVNKLNDLNGVNDDQGENRQGTINQSAQRRKIDDDEIQGARIGKPRLDVRIKEMNFTERTWNLTEFDDEVISAPFQYLASLPSKGVRDQAVDAFNLWIQAPQKSINVIKTVINGLHHASLMLDDFQDSSPLRRGRPAAHTIFGAAQTVNSANYWILEAQDEIRKLESSECLDIFIGEMRNLYIGQSFDLYWTYNVECPTVEEYLKMIDNKTGGLFRMLAKLMLAKSPKAPKTDLGDLPTLLGRYFQIRDDYQNLISPDYIKAKGLCEDLDEGKYSLPLIHTLQNSRNAMQIHSMLMQRRVAGKSKFEHKRLLLEHLEQNQSLDFTAEVLKSLRAKIEGVIKKVEIAERKENSALSLLVQLLAI